MSKIKFNILKFNTPKYNISMNNSIFLNSIQVYGLYGVNYEQVFVKNNVINTVNHVRIGTDDEADMFSALIEMLSTISDKVIYPTNYKNDWVVIITYSIWEDPIELYDIPLKTIEVKIESSSGNIVEEAYEVSNGDYYLIENDVHLFPGFSRLNASIITELTKLNFYRWNPRLDNLDCIYDYSNYFLGHHEKWFKNNPLEYREEMEAVLHLLKEDFENLVIVGGDNYAKPFNVYIVENSSQMEIPLDKMDNDFQNFFLSYGEFKRFKDDFAGAMGFYMLDCKSKLYISIFTSMLISAFEKPASQFFFIYWKDDIIEKLDMTYAYYA